MSRPAGIEQQLAEKRRDAADVLELIRPGDDLVVGIANAEPVTVVDAIEAGADALSDVRIHQVFPLRERPHMRDELEGLRHVSWFLSPFIRDAYHKGTIELVPNNFSDVPHLLRASSKCSLVLAAVAPPDRHGYFSLGTHAEYVAALIGERPFFVEVNERMPRTFGENQVHVSEVEGWCEADYPLFELPQGEASDKDRKIAELVVERVQDGATIQAGVGSVPDQVLELLGDRKELGVHTELFGEGMVDLVEAGVITGTRKRTHRNKIVATSALGDARLYDFVGDNPGVEFWPVSYTNDSANIAREDRMTAINATLEVDFLGQCASESLGTEYWSSSGGQLDFARGAIMAREGQSFIVLHSTPHDESCSRIVPELHTGAAVTTHKNVVDKVVTEHGVAELRGRSIRERTRRLIEIAHPKFRDELRAQARELGYD